MTATATQAALRPENLQRLAHADLLVMVSTIFSPPSEETKREFEDRAAALDETLAAGDLAETTELAKSLRELRQLVADSDIETWAGEHNRLFESGVACAINEAGYVRRDKGAILSDIAGFYSAFDLQLQGGSGERIDHLVCELDFVTMALVMLVRAEESGDQEQAQITHEALSSFAHDHLGEWVGAFCDRLTERSDLTLYHTGAASLAYLWRRILDHNQLPDVDKGTPVEAEEDPGTPYECGMAEAFEV